MTRKIVFTLLLSIPLFGAISCRTITCVEPDANCQLSPDPGLCEAAIPRYFFNPETCQCEEFTWGGCGGTVPFEQLEACQIECGCGR